MQIAHACGAAEIKVVVPLGRADQIQFQPRVAHIAAHRAIPPRIHHQSPQGPIRLNPQVHPAMGHLHRAGQQQTSGHGPAQQGCGEKGEAMAMAGVAAGHGGGDRHQADPSSGRRGSQHLISHHPIFVSGSS